MGLRADWSTTDFYRTLGVEKTATQVQITRAYRKLAKMYHPDVHPGKEEQFKAASYAYEVLSNPETRKEYDNIRAGAANNSGGSGSASSSGTSGTGSGPSSGSSSRSAQDDFNERFAQMFNRKQKPPRTRVPTQGADIHAKARLGFVEAAAGSIVAIRVDSDVVCDACKGSGSADGGPPVVCPECQGMGTILVKRGFFAMQETCSKCRGIGERTGNLCKSCGGTGAEFKNRTVKVRIPPGVHDGEKITVRKGGNAGRYGGAPGDLYVTVHVAPHSLFHRLGEDLLLTAPITFAEAVFGAEITVPGLDGPFVLKVPPGSRSGQRLRVKRKGLAKSGKKERGDLLVTLEIDVPDKPTPEQRSAIEALAEVIPKNPREHWRS